MEDLIWQLRERGFQDEAGVTEVYETAEKCCLKAAQIYARVLGADHPRTLDAHFNLSNIYSAQGKYNAAEELYKEVLSVYKKELGVNHAAVSNNLTVCDDCMIGAGAVVVNGISRPGTYIGIPARLQVNSSKGKQNS